MDEKWKNRVSRVLVFGPIYILILAVMYFTS